MLPAKKTSHSRSRTRRAHKKLRPVNYSICPKCSQAKLSHAACANCGYVNPQITLKVSKEEQEA